MKRIFIVAVAILALTSCDKIDVKTIKRIVIRGNASYEEVFNKVATPLSEGQTKLHLVLPEEPSDEMLKQLMHEVAEEARIKNERSHQKLFQKLKEETIELKFEGFQLQHLYGCQIL